VVRARYDAAQTTKDNGKHWAAADHLSADMEAAPEVRRTLRMRSRYEVANNSYAKGLVQMLANDTIGTGPRLQMLSSDENFNDEVESAFMKWADAAKLAAKLRTMRMSRCQDGEAFAVLATNPKVRDPVKLDLLLIEADRISGDLRWLEENTSVDGISFDHWGNPVDYRVLKYHPGDVHYMPGDEAIHVPADYMLHIFRQDRPGLHRGVPELTAALPLFAQLRRYNLAVLSAAEAAADFAAILYTDAPPNGESDEVEPMDSIPLERNMMLTVPAGWKMGQLDPKQPAANHAEFVKIILSEIARCVCSTYGTLAGDFSGHNYASGRLDNQIYHKSILVDRSFWEMEVLNRIFEAWFREYSLTTTQTVPAERHLWFWDGAESVDPAKTATAQEKRLANNTTTLAAECAKEGRDYLSVLRQRAKEYKLMRELGIPIKDDPAAVEIQPEPDDGSEPKEPVDE
jgi:Bacteriophage capsid protein